jgi:signal peptidase
MREVSLKQNEFKELSTEIFSKGGLLRFKAHGVSMVPFIRDGDILTIQSVEISALNMADVAFYQGDNGRLTAHRIVAQHIQDDQIILMMRGDMDSGPAERIQKKQVLGRVVSVQRGQKIFSLNRDVYRLAGLLWIRLSPLSLLLFRLVRIAKRAALRFAR